MAQLVCNHHDLNFSNLDVKNDDRIIVSPEKGTFKAQIHSNKSIYACIFLYGISLEN
jgi:hypothetical protein